MPSKPRTNSPLDGAELQKWFSLDDIVQAALADVIAADAQFQLRQAEAWQNFRKSLNAIDNIPHISSADLAVGYGRLENLALSELEIKLPVEVRSRSFFRRCWWGLLQFFGIQPDNETEHYRLSRYPRGWKNPIELKLSLVRNAHGQWQAKPLTQASNSGTSLNPNSPPNLNPTLTPNSSSNLSH